MEAYTDHCLLEALEERRQERERERWQALVALAIELAGDGRMNGHSGYKG